MPRIVTINEAKKKMFCPLKEKDEFCRADLCMFWQFDASNEENVADGNRVGFCGGLSTDR